MRTSSISANSISAAASAYVNPQAASIRCTTISSATLVLNFILMLEHLETAHRFLIGLPARYCLGEGRRRVTERNALPESFICSGHVQADF